MIDRNLDCGCFVFVWRGNLELGGGGESISIGMGDGLALLQAIGFGTGLFLSKHMMKQHTDQALPIMAILVATTAFWAMVWILCDGWMGTVDGWEMMTLPNLLFKPSMHNVALAVFWTGLLSISLNFFLEVVAVGNVPAAEASVILAREPLWAAAFVSLLLGVSFGWNNFTGGFFIVAACLVNGLQANVLQDFLSGAAAGQTQAEETFLLEAQSQEDFLLVEQQQLLLLQVNATSIC
jgi:drug/metabolite transporter (DMT)-like permease